MYDDDDEILTLSSLVALCSLVLTGTLDLPGPGRALNLPAGFISLVIVFTSLCCFHDADVDLRAAAYFGGRQA